MAAEKAPKPRAPRRRRLLAEKRGIVGLTLRAGVSIHAIRTRAGRASHPPVPLENPRRIAYDAYGRIATDTIPAGAYSAFTYDDEGEPTGYSAFGSVAATIAYTNRGELTKEAFSNFVGGCAGTQNSGYEGMQQTDANGYMVPISYGPLDSSGNTCGWTDSGQDFDARTAANIGSNSPNGSNDVYYTFDAAGRQTSASQNYYGTFTCGDL